MRRFDWRWFAVSSMIVVAMAASAETRPQYGGVLHVAMRAAPASLDPVDVTWQAPSRIRSPDAA